MIFNTEVKIRTYGEQPKKHPLLSSLSLSPKAGQAQRGKKGEVLNIEPTLP